MAQHSTHRHPPGLSSLPGAELLAEACGVAPTRMVVVFLRDPDGHERCVGVINKLLNVQCCSVMSVAREFQCQTQREFFIEEGERETEHLWIRQPCHGIGGDPFLVPRLVRYVVLFVSCQRASLLLPREGGFPNQVRHPKGHQNHIIPLARPRISDSS